MNIKSKIKYIVPAIALPVLALTFLGTGIASAHGGWGSMDPIEAAKQQQTMFEKQASVLGINVSELKDDWAQGKTLQDIAKEKGISETDLRAKMDAQRKQEQQDRLKALVSSGVITQAQADQRMQFEAAHPPMQGKGPGKMGMHRPGGMVGQRGPQGQNQQPPQNN